MNGVIALWPNTGVVKFKYHVSQKQIGFNNKIHCTVFYSLLYLNSWRGFNGQCVQRDGALGSLVQGGEDSKDALSCRSFSTQEPLNIGRFCGKRPIKIRNPMSLRHPVKAFYQPFR